MQKPNPFVMPNLDDPYEHEKLRRGPSKQSDDIEVQRRYNLIENRLEEFKGVNDLGNVDPKE